MVAKIKFGKSVSGALNYNENKLEKGTAECIGSNGFLKEVNTMNFYQKLEVFTNRNDLNVSVGTNTIHISLNFDPSEKLDKHVLNSIASSYMEKIGFSDQPFLVYEHRDAGHPHIHIVSTIIQPDGRRIPTHYIGKERSEKARKEIEKEFSLVVAQAKKIDEAMRRITASRTTLEQVIYGHGETKKDLARVVSVITSTYKFTSLAELNAVLRLYNVNSSRGGEKSQMFQKGGLHYSVVNEKGERVGIPIKASALPGKPMLKTLQKKFRLNETLRAPLREPLKRTVDAALLMPAIKTPDDFANLLKYQNIRALWRINKEGRVYGITFVDQTRKTVFNGSDLGKSYTVTSILEKLSAKEDTVTEIIVKPIQRTSDHHQDHGLQRKDPGKETPDDKEQDYEQLHERHSRFEFTLENLAYVSRKEDLTSPENALRLRKKKRKKKKS